MNSGSFNEMTLACKSAIKSFERLIIIELLSANILVSADDPCCTLHDVFSHCIFYDVSAVQYNRELIDWFLGKPVNFISLESQRFPQLLPQKKIIDNINWKQNNSFSRNQFFKSNMFPYLLSEEQ